MFSVSITHNSKIKEFSDENKKLETEFRVDTDRETENTTTLSPTKVKHSKFSLKKKCET